jgi:hypothetical protein
MKAFIILIICLLVSLTGGCHLISSQPGDEKERGAGKTDRNRPIPELGALSKAYGQPRHLADLRDKAVDESSGVVASRRNPGFIWTHNDSGDGPFLYAFDRAGNKSGVWRVTGAKAYDWEDIASGPGTIQGQSYLYIGDIGDNGKKRETITVYRVVEPAIAAGGADTDGLIPQLTEQAEAIRLRYPDGRHDAEALAVHPTTGDLYIITKTRKMSSGAAVYKLTRPFSTSAINALAKVSDISLPSLVPGMITGADISPDGRKLILCDYFNAFEMVLPNDSTDGFDEIWNQPISIIRLGQRPQGEAISYRLDGQAILATSEGSPAKLIEVEALK